MTWLRDALVAHQTGLTLLHGQAFFVLSLSIVFLVRRSARLEIAQDLVLVAAFGICEALAAWSRAWLGLLEASVLWIIWLRVLLLGAGYAFLLAFGLQIYLPSKTRAWLRWVLAGGLFTLWLVGLLIAHLSGLPSEQVWAYGEVAARYGLALPGGILGAWAVRQEAHRSIEPARLSAIRTPLRIMGFALGVFALVGGVIGPSAPFLPANWINEDWLLQFLGVPISPLRATCGVAITYGVVRALGVVSSEIKLWLEGMERMQALASERERIGRELHDGTIQSIYASGLMLESVRHHIPDDPEKARGQLDRAIKSLNQTIQDIRRYIFDLRGEMPEDDLETGLRKILTDFRVNTLLETSFILDGKDGRRLPAERRQHIFQIVREALTNTARHAQAQRVEMDLRYGENALQLRVSDDGIGLAALPTNDGHGLRNIRERTRLLGGMLDIDTAPNEGLTLILTVPY